MKICQNVVVLVHRSPSTMSEYFPTCKTTSRQGPHNCACLPELVFVEKNHRKRPLYSVEVVLLGMKPFHLVAHTSDFSTL